LTNNEYYDDTPCSSPDGLKIAYSTPDGIHTMNVDGANMTKILGTSAGEMPKPVNVPTGGAPATAGAPTFVGDIPCKWR